MTKKLALFDFDGTITRKDSFVEFMIFSQGYLRLLRGGWLLFPVILLYFFGILSNAKAKQVVLKAFFKDWSLEHWEEAAARFTVEVLPGIIKKSAFRRIQWHQAEGHDVCLVSASAENWLAGFCRKYDIKMICTKLEIKNGRITGKFLTPNCYGPEKVRRIKEALNLDEYGYIYAYGDTRGDREMLALADEPYYRHFH